jgi:predicted XRE-type DNA-binding protein
MVFKVSDGEGVETYFEHDENVMTIVSGFIDYAEPNQKMIIETLEVTREELQNLPRGW